MFSCVEKIVLFQSGKLPQSALSDVGEAFFKKHARSNQNPDAEEKRVPHLETWYGRSLATKIHALLIAKSRIGCAPLHVQSPVRVAL